MTCCLPYGIDEEAATSGKDAACLVNLTLEDVRQTVAAMIKRAMRH